MSSARAVDPSNTVGAANAALATVLEDMPDGVLLVQEDGVIGF